MGEGMVFWHNNAFWMYQQQINIVFRILFYGIISYFI